MKLFKTKWEKMLLELITTSFSGVTLYEFKKDDPKSKNFEKTVHDLIYDSTIDEDKYYNVFFYGVSMDKKNETMLMHIYSGAEIYSNIYKDIISSDGIQLTINEVKPEFSDHIQQGNYLCLGDDHLIKPPLKNFIVIKEKQK